MKTGTRVLLEGPDGAGKTTLATRLADVAEAAGCRVLRVSDPNHAVGAVNAAGAVSLRDILLQPVVVPDRANNPRALTRDVAPTTPRLPLGEPLPPAVASALFCAGEAYTAQCVLEFERRAFAEGERPVTIFDRWSPSTIVYQALPNNAETRAWQRLKIDRVQAVTRQYCALVKLKMTTTVLLTTDTKTGAQCLYERSRGRGVDAYESAENDVAQAAFLRRLDAYRRLPALLERWAPSYALWMRLHPAGLAIVDAAQPLKDVFKDIRQVLSSSEGLFL